MAKGKIFFLSIIILVGISSILGFWFWQKNVYSTDTLKIEILADSNIQVGQETDYLVKIKNNGDVRLENPTIVFEFPKNAVIDREESTSTVKKIGDIYPGQEISLTFKCRIFGKAGDIAKANTWITYTPRNLKAQFESRTSHTAKVIDVPLTFEIDSPLKTEQGEIFELSLNYFSNIDYLLSNLYLSVEYPDGFIFIESSPKALDTNTWNLPILAQANGGRVKIKGKLEGELESQKVFKAKLGVLLDNQFIVLKEASALLEISKADIFISQTINGLPNYSAKAGEVLRYDIYFKNIGKKTLQNKFLFVDLEGDFFDLATLSSDSGEIAQNRRSLAFDWKNISSLRFLAPGEEGRVSFTVRLKENLSQADENAALLKTTVNMAGIEKVFIVKVSSQLGLSQKVFYENDVFPNSGSFPLEINTPTSFTVVWQVKNGFNNLNNAKIKAVLPENVSLTGKFFPENAGFTFDSASREILWQIGVISANQELVLAFQIQVNPQTGGSVLLLSQAEFLANDVFADDIISIKAGSINSNQVEN